MAVPLQRHSPYPKWQSTNVLPSVKQHYGLKRGGCFQFPQKPLEFVPLASNISPPPPENEKEKPPAIQLEFIGPTAGPTQEASVISGEKLLRNIMLDNNIELYAAYILQGEELLNERTSTEERYLKKKPETWRLACQTIVGNKENSGKVIVQRIPQWKKT
ncbi:photosynthetic NDH subunit of subcomplex B 3, chloroplastic isoform X2 [Cryptomeria japonica]|uniref:photosynthetic NDH subunit of subcomplex B 3, chloroplastic isoform X2 n=1 Tax=Cryptomeria japonica TaxID=3369 RepID=UPI0027DA1690|nr:photosynthetic NDH subunit of subcomplex B 3, chloroplastic isoform X2 [Cryptomeria japonica]